MTFENYLSLLGYKLSIAIDEYDCHKCSLSPYIDGVVNREDNVSFLVDMLNSNNKDLIETYYEAISTYGNSEYKSCIDSCRTLIEKFFKKLDLENNDFSKGVLLATKEIAPDSSNSPRLSQNGIFKYWIDEKKGFNRYRLFVTSYSLMSGLGTHGEEKPSQQDALLTLRITEDVLIWYFQKNKLA